MSAAVDAFDSEAGYRDAIDMTLAGAGQEIRIFDRNLEGMALDEPARSALLATFLVGGNDRRIKIVVHDPERLPQNFPRLMALMRGHSHAVEIRQSPDHLRGVSDCQVLADRKHGALRTHADHARGKRYWDCPNDIHPWWQRFDELWHESQPCCPATSLGL